MSKQRPAQPPILAGAEGILAATIARATLDAVGGDYDQVIDALAYFHGPVYRHHATALGLPGNARPVVLQDDATLIRIADMLLEASHETKTH